MFPRKRENYTQKDNPRKKMFSFQILKHNLNISSV